MRTPSAEAQLRRDLHTQPGLAVVTGGQTGVDTYAAQAALRAGLPMHLVYPAGLRQEDGRLTPSRRRQFRGAALHELPDASFRYRTWTGVYASDAVLLLDPAGGSGCQETARAARKLGRPLLSPDVSALTANLAISWLTAIGAQVLLVAGCRASVLDAHDQEPALRAGLAAFMAGARLRHGQLAESG